MTDASTPANIWPVLMPVIVGGSLAILGGALSPIVSHILSARSARQARRVQRFEEMMAAVYEHDHWLDGKRHISIGQEVESGPPPIHKARSIVLMNFEELRAPIRELDLASSRYQHWMAEVAVNRSKGVLSVEGFQAAYKIWLDEFTSFQDVAAAYVRARNGKV
ncbi:hypothetical protein HJC04_26330 [Rhizobium sp. NLR8a]|uniref:hypothetical protein n=1 Tax=Rhizobium sp. NLR8a TaxID=2731119 RepID=UPI001C83B9CF|nr:hypothetical protein [Rhizobium sp. NLR8a]MBX5223797.1 hypothetical protein [Rhizobium sp. NLR8a]